MNKILKTTDIPTEWQQGELKRLYNYEFERYGHIIKLLMGNLSAGGKTNGKMNFIHKLITAII